MDTNEQPDLLAGFTWPPRLLTKAELIEEIRLDADRSERCIIHTGLHDVTLIRRTRDKRDALYTLANALEKEKIAPEDAATRWKELVPSKRPLVLIDTSINDTPNQKTPNQSTPGPHQDQSPPTNTEDNTNRDTSDIYNQLKKLHRQLSQLSNEQRIRMCTDTANTDYPEPQHAINDAITGIEQAINATAWMETTPKNSEFPPLCN